MLQISKILVPMDFSVNAKHSAAYALHLGRILKAEEIHLVHVDLYGGNPDELAEALQKAELELQSEIPVVTRVVRANYHAAPGIVQYAEANKMELIIMGTHGLRGMRRFLLGSVAEEVVRTTPCPVVTLHERPEGVLMPEYVTRILVPIDYSEFSRVALEEAKYLADKFGAGLDLVYVLEDWPYPPMFGISVPSISETNPEMVTSAENAMHRFFADTPGPKVSYTVNVLFGSVVNTIKAYAEENDSSMIIIATHGINNEIQELIGSTTEKLIRTCMTPIYSLRPIIRKEVKEKVRPDTWIGPTTSGHVA